MPRTRYLSALDVEALHVFIMDKTGGAPAGIRDRALLQSAVMRPQMAAFYSGADLVEQCALLALGISHAQAFVDGNKRTAFIAADVFLRLNGRVFTGDPLDMARQLESEPTRERDEQERTTRFIEWLRQNMSGAKS